MTTIDPSPDNTSVEIPPRAPQSLAGRVLAGIGGTILLIVTARYTLGGAAVGVVGVAIASLIAWRRGRTLSRPMSWLAVGVAVQVALLAAFGYGATKISPATMASMRRTIDSSQANPPPPPAWLERIAPGASARAKATQPAMNPSFGVGFVVFGAVLSTSVLGALVGTVGWLVAFPLAFALTGRWLGTAKGG